MFCSTNDRWKEQSSKVWRHKKIQTSILGQIVSEIVAQLCSNDSIITNPSRFHSVLNELSQI